MSIMTTKATNERSKLMTASIDSTQSEYSTSSSITSTIPKCNFVVANKKPLITIGILIFLGLTATLTMLWLDHEGFWDKPDPIDKIWFQQTLTNTTTPQGLYPLWLKAATINNNNQSLYLYKSQYGPLWNTDQSQKYNYSTLLTQSQLIYNFATAYAITRNMSYYMTMIHGINVLLARFNDIENGGFYYSINETNTSIIIDKTKNSIAHSLTIYAISVAFISTPNSEIQQKETYLEILNHTYDVFQEYFLDDYGGIYDNLSNNWSEIVDEKDIKSQQSLMYYFEALSQLLRVAQNIYYTPKYRNLLSLNLIKQDIVSIFDFVCNDLLHPYTSGQIDYYVLYEKYNKNWTQPLSSYVSLGNAYKWSYLISYFIDNNIIETNVNNPNRDYAILFLQYAINLGYDEELYRIHDKIDYDKYSNPPYWTVCNGIKTVYYYWNFYDEEDNENWLDILQNIIIYYQDYYYDMQYGGVYYSKPSQLWKGNISKLDYECIDMTLFVADLSY